MSHKTPPDNDNGYREKERGGNKGQNKPNRTNSHQKSNQASHIPFIMQIVPPMFPGAASSRTCGNKNKQEEQTGWRRAPSLRDSFNKSGMGPPVDGSKREPPIQSVGEENKTKIKVE